MNKALLAITLVALLAGSAFVTFEPPPQKEGCTPWTQIWEPHEESILCDNTGTYVMWICYNKSEQHLYFCHQCYYSTHTEDVNFLYLPIVTN